MTKKFDWGAWWKEGMKVIPLGVCIFIALFVFGIWAFVISCVLVLYIADLYDKEWQRRMGL
jgi:hypothetical protein